MTSESIRLIQGAKTRTIESELNNGNSALKEHLDTPCFESEHGVFPICSIDNGLHDRVAVGGCDIGVHIDGGFGGGGEVAVDVEVFKADLHGDGGGYGEHVACFLVSDVLCAEVPSEDVFFAEVVVGVCDFDIGGGVGRECGDDCA